jgi:hypothetical protein
MAYTLNSYTRIHFVDDHLFPLITGHAPETKNNNGQTDNLTSEWQIQNKNHPT